MNEAAKQARYAKILSAYRSYGASVHCVDEHVLDALLAVWTAVPDATADEIRIALGLKPSKGRPKL